MQFHSVRNTKGFTIVELLIVIVVIGILAAIVIIAYNGIQARSQMNKMQTDIAQINKAIQSARTNNADLATRFITGSTATAGTCIATDSAVDLADKTGASACWNAYNTSMNAISAASGMNVRGMMDPWGRPYFLDENEKEGASTCGTGRDGIAAYARPRTQNVWATMSGTSVQVPYVTPGC